MKTFLSAGIFILLTTMARPATMTIEPWSPLFRGVDYASGRQLATQGGERDHAVSCLRVDLTDPDIELFTTPRCTNACSGGETLAENESQFLRTHGVQASINCNFFTPATQSPGAPQDVWGLAISRGQIVSPQGSSHLAVFMFNTNNDALFIPNNSPPANTAGIYTALAGDRVLLDEGINPHDPFSGDLDPRTAFGLSQDRRYLYLLAFDGRQPGWSNGGNFYETGEWLRRFGAHDGINVDGGGSTLMLMADCTGAPIRLSRSSYVAGTGQERIIGHHFGVYAQPLSGPVKNLVVRPGATTAIFTWETDLAATTQVEYGPTIAYGSATAFDARLVKTHIATLAGLVPRSNYFFRAISTAGEETFSLACRFSTTATAINRTELIGLTNSWRYTTNNLDGTNWKMPAYNDAGWSGPSPAALYTETANLPPYPPLLTPLPPGVGVTPSFRTYYFRTPFNFSGRTSGLSLTFSNFIDDGAVFYLNGGELFRIRLPAAPTPINNATAANGAPCSGDANLACPDIVTVGGNLVTNLVQGTNLLAAELHNQGSGFDVVFASALFGDTPAAVSPDLNISMTDSVATLYWNGEGFTLQRSVDLSSAANWTDVSGLVATSPVVITNVGTVFYRLRN